MFLCVLLELHRTPAEQMGKEGGGGRKKRSKRTRLENLKILNFFTEYSVNSCLLCMTALVPMNMVIFPAELPHWTPCCHIILAIATETSVTFPKSAS